MTVSNEETVSLGQMERRPDRGSKPTLYVYVKKSPLQRCPWNGQPTGPRGEVPIWTYFPDLASNFGSRHTADCVLPPTDNFALGTKGLPKGHRDQSGIPRLDVFCLFIFIIKSTKSTQSLTFLFSSFWPTRGHIGRSTRIFNTVMTSSTGGA